MCLIHFFLDKSGYFYLTQHYTKHLQTLIDHKHNSETYFTKQI